MKQTEWNQSLDHLDSDLIETYIAQKDRQDSDSIRFVS